MTYTAKYCNQMLTTDMQGANVRKYRLAPKFNTYPDMESSVSGVKSLRWAGPHQTTVSLSVTFSAERSVVVPPWGAEYDHKLPITHTASVSMTNLQVQYGLRVYKRASGFKYSLRVCKESPDSRSPKGRSRAFGSN
ncbi:hypothetical protein Rs2_38655 [Raphanus sativus]|nr:hypothetical protein Rs2_38655 [Raphanus sativus]